MAKRRLVRLQFPLAGVNRRTAYQNQPPYTTPSALNVCPDSSANGRASGGSRVGLTRNFFRDLPTSIRLLNCLRHLHSSGQTFWEDHFDGYERGALWNAGTWSGPPVGLGSANILFGDGMLYTEDSDGFDLYRDYLLLTPAAGHIVQVGLVPYQGQTHGKYRLYAWMTTGGAPDPSVDGIIAEIDFTNTTGSYDWWLAYYDGGGAAQDSATGSHSTDVMPGLFQLRITSTTVYLYLNNYLLAQKNWTNPNALYYRVGFGALGDTTDQRCQLDNFRLLYDDGAAQCVRESVVFSAGGNDLYYENYPGYTSNVNIASTPLRDDVLLESAARLNKLYIADYAKPVVEFPPTISQDTQPFAYTDSIFTRRLTADEVSAIGVGTDKIFLFPTADVTITDIDWLGRWTINALDNAYTLDDIPKCRFTVLGSSQWTQEDRAECRRFEAAAYVTGREPKVYDAENATMALWVADTDLGFVPANCNMICVWRDRLVLANEHWYFMSRQGNPNDWHYWPDPEAEDDPVMRSAGDDTLQALAPFSDDYLILGCRRSIWKLAGDPKAGGIRVNLSRSVGIVGPRAWCHGPSGELIFLSHDGLYALAPGEDSYPVSISRERLPAELLNIDASHYLPLLGYDARRRGIWIFLTTQEITRRYHWWFDWTTKGFWPVEFSQWNHEPVAICERTSGSGEEQGLLVGGGDGKLRQFSNRVATDDGYQIASSVWYGPIRLGGSDYRDGILTELLGTLAGDSCDVTWRLYAAETIEEALNASAFATGVWSAGRNYTARPRARANSIFLRISAAGGRRYHWTTESTEVAIRAVGVHRKL